MSPYIGITGFMSGDEVSFVLESFPNNSERKLMVGVLASGKTIKGIPNDFLNRYPKPENMGNIFKIDKRCLNFVHLNSKKPPLFMERFF
ncbi:MAG: hypothetical protein Q8Q06_00855 [bacterium]|nr:hypothetical protein [bacterium]